MDRSNFIMIAKGIVLYVTLNIRLIIEEGGVICDMVFVIRCLSVFLCFKMSFSLISKNFHISYTRTPNPLTPLQAISLLLPQEKTQQNQNLAKPKNFQIVFGKNLALLSQNLISLIILLHSLSVI